MKELRIGNFVMDESGIIVMIDSVNENGINHDPDIETNTMAKKEVLPITITDKWCEAFGLLYSEFGGFITDEGECIEEDSSLGFSIHGSRYFKYVHELQNIFYSYYGKELEFSGFKKA